MSDVNRLVDMEVEEVSLVDRAANKRRFLLVKRDNMENQNKESDQETEASGGPVESEKAVGDPVPDAGSDSAEGDVSADPIMGTAVSALEALTELVENIGELGSSPEANSKLADLATSLTEIAQVILSQVGKPPAEEPPAEPPADAAAGETPPEDPEAAEKSDDKVADSLEKAKALVEQFGSVVKSGVSKKDDSAALAKSIEDINASIKKFTDVLTETCQRVSKVEKQFGVPASQPAESVTKAASAEVAWPADLNAPTKSRENA